MRHALLAFVPYLLAAPAIAQTRPAWLETSGPQLEAELVALHGDAQRERARRGIQQVAALWRNDDGDQAAFETFVRTHFAGDDETLDALFSRMQFVLESAFGHMSEVGRDARMQIDVDIGPILPFDEILAAYDPLAHFNDDWFANKLAFVVLLNFPLTSLDERLEHGAGWTRRQWAETRLAERFSKRIPTEVDLAIGRAWADASRYIDGYNVWMHHVVDASGRRLFPEDLRLLAHWNLRDEIKAGYALPADEALPRQRMIQRVMERIIDQTIPDVVIDNPHVDWDPEANSVRASTVLDASAERGREAPASVTGTREPDRRYEMILGNFRAGRLADPWSPSAPTLIQRTFDEDRQITEARVRALLEEVLGAPVVPRVADLIRSRLGRDLEPFDVWYAGFRSSGGHESALLDSLTRARFPTARAYDDAMADLLVDLGFAPDRAAYLAANIEVDPSRGSGHAMPSYRRGDNPRLRTRVEPTGMDYKGFNIAVHEMGHNVEQVFSLKDIDYWTLAGVPNNAFTEALAFVLQARDVELLGLSQPSPEVTALRTLNDFWSTWELAGVGLVDMEMWRWMYAHPDATPAELRDAVLGIARDVWNTWYAPVLGERDVTLLAVYSHMVAYPLYLPDYALGRLIALQIEEHIQRSGNLGAEFERMSRIGNVSPDLWMTQATGTPIATDALVRATEEALSVIQR